MEALDREKQMYYLISHQPGADKIYLHAKDTYEVQYQLLINKHEGVGLKGVSTTFLLVCFVCLKGALVKQGKMFFISLRKLFLFMR